MDKSEDKGIRPRRMLLEAYLPLLAQMVWTKPGTTEPCWPSELPPWLFLPSASLCVGRVPPPPPEPLSPGCEVCAERLAIPRGYVMLRALLALPSPPGPSRDDDAGELRGLERVRGQLVPGQGPEHCRPGWASPPWSPAGLPHSGH